jgi:hypothetical protein
MIWRATRKTRARPAPSRRPATARGIVRVAVTLLGGLAVTTAAAPAFAEQHPARQADPGQHSDISRMPPGPLWTHIAPGGDHTCATRANGTPWWGINNNGQLGLGYCTVGPGPAYPYRSRSLPRPGMGGPASAPARTTPAPSAPAAPCGAGDTTPTVSSASATRPTKPSCATSHRLPTRCQPASRAEQAARLLARAFAPVSRGGRPPVAAHLYVFAQKTAWTE